MRKLHIIICMVFYFLGNSVFAQSIQKQPVNTTALNSIMAQGYELCGTIGDNIVVEKDYGKGILKTNGQWLLKPSNQSRIAVISNAIICEENTNDAELQKVYDNLGNELISIKLTSNMTEEEALGEEKRLQLVLVNQLLKADGKIKELPNRFNAMYLAQGYERALDDGYLITRSGVLNRNGELIFNSENVNYLRYYSNGIFYLKNNESFVNANNINEKSNLNNLLEQGYSIVNYDGYDDTNDFIVMQKDGKFWVVSLEGQLLSDSGGLPQSFYNLLECQKDSVVVLLNNNNTITLKYEEWESAKHKIKANFIFGKKNTFELPMQDCMQYNKKIRNSNNHIYKALKDGYLICRFYLSENDNTAYIGVLDKNGKIRIKSNNDIVYCGNGLFALDKGKDKYSFTHLK